MSKVIWHVTMSLDGFIAGPHRPPEASGDPSLSFVSSSVGDGVATTAAAAGGKSVGIFGADIARQRHSFNFMSGFDKPFSSSLVRFNLKISPISGPETLP